MMLKIIWNHFKMINTIYGDLIEKAKNGEFDVIIHGCNCFCTMGGGIAKTIKNEFIEAFNADRKTIKGSKDKLGTCSFANIERNGFNFIVVNAYTQFNYGYGKMADYDAIEQCMKWIKDSFKGKRFGLPLIGAGLAGGDWNKILQIINDVLGDEDITIIKYKRI